MSTRAFVWSGKNWDDSLRKDPLLKWLETYTEMFDSTKPEFEGWHTNDFSLIKADGTEVTGGQQAWEAARAIYDPTTKFNHQPYYAISAEVGNEVVMIGEAWLYANLVGEASTGEQKVKDANGQEWDIRVPGAFHFACVKHGSSFQLKQTKIFSDSFPIIQVLMKRGVIKG